ncbi:hypothetical protein HMN09_01025100 [Mycena chlorophos]|uniref:protein-tyrosine-phosphatase n=1 Tax=Mycena chlorophos TaxID=658473 RepID=A0A8H6W1D5_MYCCL|nr:hypothetical protein HMN09_01025100 [Mycena chlorophos]
MSACDSQSKLYTYYASWSDLDTLLLLAASPRQARASPPSFLAVACRRSRRRRHRSDAELDASTPCAPMACAGEPSNALRGPKRARTANAHPYARPEQPVKRRALSLTLGLNLNFPASNEGDSTFSAPPKLTSNISTNSLENYYPVHAAASCSSASTSSSSTSFSSWPSSSATSFSSASSSYAPSPATSPCDYTDPPPPSGAPILRADDPALAPYLSSQPSFSSLTSSIAIGDLAFAEDAAALEREGITHVVSVVSGRVHVPDVIPPSNRLHIPLPDTPFAELVGALASVLEWVKAALQSQLEPRILIHCAHGISRSPAVGAGLLISMPLVDGDDGPAQLSAAAALDYVRARRPAADVNWGFARQLVEWEGLCRDSSR